MHSSRPARSFVSRPFVVIVVALACGRAQAQSLDVHYDGDQGSSLFGQCVSSGFDLDGDGADDVLIGIPSEDVSGVTDAGEVRVLSGRTHALLLDIPGPLGSNAEFGFAAALVGDMDGDGVCDVVIGAPGYSSHAGYVGAFSGASGALLWNIVGGAGSELGASISAAGDVDHDGHMDVVVGAPGAGVVYLYGWGTGALHTWSNSQTSCRFGAAVLGNVDVDGDGTMDVVIGTPYYDTAFPFRLDRGRIDVFSGSTYAQIFGALGDGAGDHLGVSLAVLPVSLSGVQVLAGAPQGLNGSGYVRQYDATGVSYFDWTDSQATGFGTVLTGCRDIDGDGYSDFAISTNPSPTSTVEWYTGKWGYCVHIFHPDANGAAFGWSLASGDVDGDGISDLLIGDAYRLVGAVSKGGVDVFRAVPATATHYGTGWPGELGDPQISAPPPGLNESFYAVSLSDSSSKATTALLFVGLNQANVPTSKGGTLLVSPFVTVVVPVPPGGTLFLSGIPDDPTLTGVHVYLQAIEFDPIASKGLSFTDGLDLMFGIG